MKDDVFAFSVGHSIGIATGAFLTALMTQLEIIKPTPGQQVLLGVFMLGCTWFKFWRQRA